MKKRLVRSLDRRLHDRLSNRHLYRCLGVLLVGITLVGCSSNPNRDPVDQGPINNPFKPADNSPGTPQSPASARELNLKAATLYRRAHHQLENAEYNGADKSFDKVISQYPFTRYSTQAQLEQIYAQYRSYQTDTAGGSADRFLREHPRHPHADYVLYLKGLIDQSRDSSLQQYLPISSTEHDPTAKERAFQDFALLTQRYPHSKYFWNARQRMVSLRNEIAAHELEIARFYIRRGAWLSAAKRAQTVIANYPGAPATAKALLVLKRCYGKLGLTDQEKQVETLIAANQPSMKAADHPQVVTISEQVPPPPPADSATASVEPPPPASTGASGRLQSVSSD